MTDADHEQLLAMASKAEFNCMISTYDNDMYKSHLKGWEKVMYQSMTRRGVATETLYMNYERPDRLHDYRYLGKDCWDRQRIKRKVSRHVDRLKSLPSLERNAIIDAIQREVENKNPGE